jgi:hypothetical protein
LNLGEVIFGKKSKKEDETKKIVKSISSSKYRDSVYSSRSEAWHQEQLIMWLNAKKIYYELSMSGIYLPNIAQKGSATYKKQAIANAKVMAKMKMQGLNKGISDLKVYLKCKNKDIELNIELKSMKGRASKEQLQVKKVIDSFSFAEYHIIKGYLNAIELIEKTLSAK